MTLQKTTHGKPKLCHEGYYYNVDTSYKKTTSDGLVTWKCEFGHVTSNRQWKCNGRVRTKAFDPSQDKIESEIEIITPHHDLHLPNYSREKKFEVANKVKEIALLNGAGPRAIVKNVFSDQV